MALDLVNTLQPSDGVEADQLRSPADLLTWLGEAGLFEHPERLGPLRSPPTARTLLSEARHLRDDVSRAVTSLAAGGSVPTHVVYAINRVLAAGRVTPSLHVDDNGARLEETEDGDSTLATLVPVARAAAELVVEADPGRLRRCASETCERWFIDTSKGGRRKWCSMATCGNRAKAAAHRRRHVSA
ncbi:MAG: CGNR zinc finger domain-containing protein [Gemmatimonadota bacterium]